MAETIREKLQVVDGSSNDERIALEGEGGENGGGAIRVHNSEGLRTVLLTADFCNLVLGNDDGGGEFPGIYLVGQDGDLAVRLEGSTEGGLLGLKTESDWETIHLNGRSCDVRLGGGGRDADVFLKNAADEKTIHLDGAAGDVKLLGADCAEYFEVAETAEGVDPGTVMVSEGDGALRPSREAYDRRVVGVLSGAGDLAPGILLGHRETERRRAALAVTGTVYCNVDAREDPVGAGDLLTSSATPGHAMKATDPREAFGAVIGKALQPLESGTGLVPILVALQ